MTIDNWAMTEKQRILKNTSFESKIHDIYNPTYSSESESTRAKYARLNESSSNASSLDSLLSENSNHTEIERCSSENLNEDEIRESIIQIRGMEGRKEKK